MFRNSLAAAASLLALTIATGASAADLPRKTVAPVVVAPAFTWTGFYVGLNAGYTWSNDNTLSGRPGLDPTAELAFLFGAGLFPGSLGLSNDGFIGGAQIGYNYQFAGTAIVAGLEADIQFADAKDNTAFSAFFGEPISFSASSKLEYFGTVRARLGYAVLPQLLIYATGGLAYGQVETSFDGGLFTPPARTVAFSSSTVKTGFTIGGGAEYAMTRNWTVKVEYLYYDLGKTSGGTSGFTNTGGPFITIDLEKKHTGNIVRAGVNYKF